MDVGKPQITRNYQKIIHRDRDKEKQQRHEKEKENEQTPRQRDPALIVDEFV